MIEIVLSPQISTKKIPSIFPFFKEDHNVGLRRAFRGLTPAQKRSVRGILRSENIPQDGIIPAYSSDGVVLIHFLGEKKSFERREAREAGECIASVAKKYSFEKVNVLPGILSRPHVDAYFEGVVLGAYVFDEYRGKEYLKQKEAPFKTVHFYGPKNPDKAVRLAILTESVQFAKNIVNRPPMDATPTFLAEKARELAKNLKNVSVKILGEKELKKLGCGGILGVGQGSHHESRLIVFRYDGGNTKEKPLVLVGKGVTFDTGGLNIKTVSMRTMKQDVAGAATVMGVLHAIARLGVRKNVIVLVPTVENSIDALSYHPDDVLTMYNGMTVEVTNTDAEGRLILADALAYADKQFTPRAMVNIATLTGCAFFAVGEDITVGMANNDALYEALESASFDVDEPLWRLPLHEKYKPYLKSSVADIVHNSKKFKAGTIEGGLFLQHFVSAKTPWAHLDIGSCAWDEKSEMATGRDVRLLTQFVELY